MLLFTLFRSQNNSPFQIFLTLEKDSKRYLNIENTILKGSVFGEHRIAYHIGYRASDSSLEFLSVLISDGPPHPREYRMMTNPNERVIIAVDFGTTFSGAAWAQVNNVRLPLMISSIETYLC